MTTTLSIPRKQSVSFRWDSRLVNRLRRMAKSSNKSLNSLAESIMQSAVSTDEDTPNSITMAAINEARSGKELETLNLGNFEEYVKAL